MNIPFFRPSIGERELSAAMEVLRSGWLTSGPKCSEFEQKFSEFLGGGVESVSVNSATAGLHLAAEACGIGPGDAVLVPTLTFSASAAAFRHVGADIILVDVEPGNYSIDLRDAERKLTRRCKAIVPVHFGGWPCDMPAIMSFARRNQLKVIEDAAHALPGRRDGRPIGSWESDACVFSFYANKTMTTGEGGMLTTRHADIAARARVMRSHGLNRDAFDRFRKVGASWSYDIIAPGFKYNLPDLSAAIGIVQLSRVEEFQAQRQRIAGIYLDRLARLPIDLPSPAPQGGLHSWHLFPIRVRPKARLGRDDLIALLTQEGIGTSVHYRPLHQMTYWRGHYRALAGEFPISDSYFEGAVSLPLFPGMLDSEAEHVASILRRALG